MPTANWNVVPGMAAGPPPPGHSPGDLPGINFLLIGPPGTGKTTSLKTLLKVADLKVFALFTEPRFDVLGKEVLDKIHWRYIPSATASWKTLIKTAKDVNSFGNDHLQKLPGIEKVQCQQFIAMLEQLANFRDQNDEEFGPVDEWGTDYLLWVDGLTGINKTAKHLAVGMKPILSQPDWGVSMATIGNLVDKLAMDTKCHFVLVAHIEREMDEITMGERLTISTLGRKLAPQIVPPFGDVVLAVKEGNSFTWDTASNKADLKSANLPNKAKIPADFELVIQAWIARGGRLK